MISMMNPGYSSGYEPDYSRMDLSATVPQRPPSHLRSSQSRATLAGSRSRGRKDLALVLRRAFVVRHAEQLQDRCLPDHIPDLDGMRRIPASPSLRSVGPRQPLNSESTLEKHPACQFVCERLLAPPSLPWHAVPHGYLRSEPGIHSGSSTTTTLPCNRPCIKAPESPLPMAHPTRGPARPGSPASCQ